MVKIPYYYHLLARFFVGREAAAAGLSREFKKSLVRECWHTAALLDQVQELTQEWQKDVERAEDLVIRLDAGRTPTASLKRSAAATPFMARAPTH